MLISWGLEVTQQIKTFLDLKFSFRGGRNVFQRFSGRKSLMNLFRKLFEIWGSSWKVFFSLAALENICIEALQTFLPKTWPDWIFKGFEQYWATFFAGCTWSIQLEERQFHANFRRFVRNQVKLYCSNWLHTYVRPPWSNKKGCSSNTLQKTAPHVTNEPPRVMNIKHL